MVRYLGRHTPGIDQRTGRKVKYKDLVEDGENRGLLVAREERDAEHPQKFARRVPLDRLNIRRPSPEPMIGAVTVIGNSGASSDLWEGNQTAVHLSLVMGEVVVTPTAEIRPESQVAPSITGTPREGETLTSSQGTWTNTPTSYAYQWYRNGVAIGSATSSTYDLVTADIGTLITVTVTASNGGGSASQTSDAVGPILQALPVNTVLPVITGTPQVGETLTVDNGTWDNTPILSYAYQWTSDGANIPGATSSSYLVTTDYAGTEIRAVVTATNAGGSASATADPVGVAPHLEALSNDIVLTGRDVLLRKANKLLVTSKDIAVAGSSILLNTARKLYPTSKNIAVTGSSVNVSNLLGLGTDFVGAFVRLSGNDTRDWTTSGGVAVPWNGTDDVDVGGWHDPSSSNTRLTVPSDYGITRVRIMANAYMSGMTGLAGAGSPTVLSIRKNGSTSFDNYSLKRMRGLTTGFTTTEWYLSTESIPATAGDYFEIMLEAGGTDTSTTLGSTYSYAMIEATHRTGDTYYGANVTKASAATGVNASGGHTVTWTSELDDSGGWHDNVTNNTRLTVPSGLGITTVRLSANVILQNLANGNYVYQRWNKNGSATYEGMVQVQWQAPGSSSDVEYQFITPDIPATAGDYFELVLVSNDTSIDIAASSRATIEAVSYAQDLSAVVTASAVASGNFTGFPAVTFNTETRDDGGWFNSGASTTRFTVPSGYNISHVDLFACVPVSDAADIGQKYGVLIFIKNGVETYVGKAQHSQTNTSASGITAYELYLSAYSVPCQAGDYFEVLHGSGPDTAITLAASRTFHIRATCFDGST